MQTAVALVAALGMALTWMPGALAETSPDVSSPDVSSPAASGSPDKPKPGRLPPRDPKVDSSIRDGLAWLAQQQKADGSWKSDTGYFNSDAPATAIALMPFLVADAGREGSPMARKYGATVQKGVSFLLRSQKEDRFCRLIYPHIVVTRVVCEACERSGDRTQKRAAQRALDAIIKAQHPDGGWGGWSADDRGDAWTSGQVCLTLKTGERIGLHVPAATWPRYATFLDKVAHESGGYRDICAARQPGDFAVTVTAYCLLGRLHTGRQPTATAFIGSVEFIDNADFTEIVVDPSAGYAVSLLMSSLGADTDWLPRYHRELIRRQQADGSWTPRPEEGRLETTAQNLVSLQRRATFVPLAGVADLSDKEFDALWQDLSASNAARAARAVRTLVALPSRTMPRAKAELCPVKRPDARRIAALFADLDSEDFTTRQRAERDLIGMAEAVTAELQEAIREARRSLEFKHRAKRVLEAVNGPVRTRHLRVLRVLEYLATDEAREFLLDLAAGVPDATLTKEARAARERFDAAASKVRLVPPLLGATMK
jgi:hypothetical protein